MQEGEVPPNLTVDLGTCEDRVAGRIYKFTSRVGREYQPQIVDDIRGVRRAVLPLFHISEKGRFSGIGTAFSVDPWDTLLTAYHVVDFDDPPTIATILSFGFAIGQIRIPNHAIAKVRESNSWRFEKADPIAAMQNRQEYRTVDLARLDLYPGHDASLIANLPIRSRPAPVTVGDWVFALGFPDIKPGLRDVDMPSILQHLEMKGAFGRVTELFPNGRGNETPVFEVAGHWPLGMSGGPVLNLKGEVVGIVSRGMDPASDGSSHGTSWGVMLEAVGINRLIPTIDDWQPQCRRCWATIVGNRPTAIFHRQEQALVRSSQTGERVEKVRLQLGTRQAAWGWDEDRSGGS